ncbi:hypothetical protein Droror1_Dr00027929 [Drosera rotundifolia]
MANDFILICCKFGIESSIIKFVFVDVFDSLQRQLSERWSHIRPDQMKLFYSVPGHGRCILRNQSDMESMISLVQVLGLRIVEVIVEIDHSSISIQGSQRESGLESRVVDKSLYSFLSRQCAFHSAQCAFHRTQCILIIAEITATRCCCRPMPHM